VNQNQEMVAVGLANIASGLFQGFSVSSSASRTPVAEAAGAKTPMTGLVGAVAIALLLVLAPALLQSLPSAALGAVVIAACLSFIDLRGMVASYRLRRMEFVLCTTSFLGVAFIGVIEGIFIAIALALLVLVWNTWHRIPRYWYGSMATRATTTWAATRKGAACPGWCCSAGMPRCSLPMPSCFGSRCCKP